MGQIWGETIFRIHELCNDGHFDEHRKYKFVIVELNSWKMKCVFNRFLKVYDFLDEDIYYIDDKYLLHRKNFKKVQIIISKRKLEELNCIKDGIFVNKYVERQGYDDEILYMDFDGKHEKKIAKIQQVILNILA